ncbi:TPA: hypothetical protein ACG3OE_000317 [Legionella pneumophila]|nr:hypothetical protein [Legionella pneumophila]HDO9820961.1 hypothetical protein [Legionella pneumophila]HDV5699669.1 hypothetical protein [Legionella pneumophila]HDV5702620.1 hypothetical protein [Legionella pneumophila]HDV5705586.1 hypothetical protein [Legionella pneumophila]
MSNNEEKIFTPTAATFKPQDHKRKTNQDFIDEQLKNLKSKRRWRNCITVFVGLLLIIQYVLLYEFLKFGFEKNIIENLQWLYLGLLGGLLLETYFLARLIVIWVFTDRPFKPDIHD